ncbi:kinase [Curvivirga sp.]|uniref:GHMP family kinase ATP-binding protein n=1 Tax=Curvivirga sp. TaxID=2856848 RepID=UPI003B5BBE0F
MTKSIDDIQHPAVRAILQEYNMRDGIEVSHAADLPARSGLGSSSAFTVGLIHSILTLKNQPTSSELLTKEAIRIEQDVIGENVGSQDQTWAAYGGLGRIDFKQNNDIKMKALSVSIDRKEKLEDHLLLFFTGVTRFADKIAKNKIQNLPNKEKQVFEMIKFVDEAQTILEAKEFNIADLGKLLHENWKLKRDLAPEVTNSFIDDIYEAAIGAGAYGGKLLGAGGGGFILFVAKPSYHQKIREKLNSLIHVNFSLGSPGSKIVVCERDGLDKL